MKRLVTVHISTGRVVAEWSGGQEQILTPQPGHTVIEVPPDNPSVIGYTWNGVAFLPPSPPAPSVSDRQVLNAIAAKLGVV